MADPPGTLNGDDEMLSPQTQRLILAAAWPLLTTLASAGDVAAPSPDELQRLEGVRWYGTYIGTAKCGYARESLERAQRDGTTTFVLATSVLLKIQTLGAAQEMTIDDRRVFGEDGGLLRFESKITSATGQQAWSGTIEGGQMQVTSEIAGQKSTKSQPAPKMTLADMLGANLLVLRGAEPGRQADASLYEPTLGKEIRAVSQVGTAKEILFNGVPTKVVPVTTTMPDIGAVASSWIGANGLSLETEQAIGLLKMRLRLEDEKLAKDITYSHDIIRASVIPVDKPLANSAQTTRLQLRLSKVDNEKVVIPSRRMRYEKLGPGEYDLTCIAEKVDPNEARPLPVDSARMKQYLAAEELVQSDAPEIIAAAKQVVGGETNSWRAACKINEWVYKNLAKVGTAAFSNALDTLRTRQGDCSEHSVLATALCRAAGIPARQASGLVYWPQGNGFVGHQWTEVWIGEWVAMDPAFGQDIADATHLKFCEGSLRDAISVYAFFSKLKIEVVSSK